MTTATKTKSVSVKQIKPVNTLQESAMLCRVHIHTCGDFEKMAPTLSRENEQAMKTESNVIKSRVKRVSRSDMAGITAGRARVKNTWIRYTMPFQDGGLRLLPVVLSEEFTEKMNEALVYFNEQKNIFLKDIYPQCITRYKERLGDLSERIPMPSPEEIKSNIRVDVTITAMPAMPKNFVSKLIAKQDDRIIGIEQMTARAIQSLLFKFEKLVGNIADKDKKVSKSMLKSLKSFCEVLPKFNVTNNQELEQLCQDCIGLTELDTDKLKADKASNTAAKSKAKTILETIEVVKKGKSKRKINLDLE